ncbi:putative duf895 domain membrane protein [Eutypa lata UCREL1]|uniref:Putative duf895 domain membrane protein n=1 Tax=Eutypa lata (strain UCR-EL1) TaxID=1287681 RepID=M7SSX2_EUTLA|nr:putative duf895 domain membrane protein [Eutypa lata UCREL1]
MNSLGAGGAQSPQLVNAANALTFCLMVVSCYFSSAIVHYIGIKGALIFGTIGYAPYAAGLYTNNRFGNEWFVLLGAALCGISAGVFWSAEAAIAIAYPEPWNRGKALGYWLTYRLTGQIIGGAINLGLNAKDSEAGKVSYAVYLAFIGIQAAGPFVALFLNKPSKVERQDGKRVELSILENPWREVVVTSKTFLKPKFLLVVLWIGQAVFAEAVYFTYLSSFGVYIMLTIGFQVNYLFLYFIITHLASNESEVIRYAALLRGTESAWQAVSYGLTSLTVFAEVGGIYMNFILWAIAIPPVWLVLRHFGSEEGKSPEPSEVRDTKSSSVE